MADIRMRFLGHPWERTTVSADAGGGEELFMALFLNGDRPRTARFAR